MKESILFSRAYADSPKCAPSRFGLLTGRHTSRSLWAIEKTAEPKYNGTRVSIQSAKLSGDDCRYNIPNTLRNYSTHNFYTGMIGKWHLMTADDNGYNYGCDQLDRQANATLYDLCIYIVKESGWDFVDGYYHSNIESKNKDYSHNPEWMVDRAKYFIDQAVHVQNSTFFLYFSLTLTHTPDVDIALRKFRNDQTPRGLLKGDDIPNNTGMDTRENIWQKAQNYTNPDKAAGLLWMDDAFGVIIDYLEELMIYDDTAVIFLNDHGMYRPISMESNRIDTLFK